MSMVVPSQNACPPKRTLPAAKKPTRPARSLPSKDPSPAPRPRAPLPPRREPGKSCCIRSRDQTARMPPTAWPARRPPQGCWSARRPLHATRLQWGSPVNGADTARRGASDPGGVEAGGHEWKSRWQSGRNPWMEAHSPPISRPRMGAEDDGPEKRTRLPDRLDPGGPGVPGSNKHCPTRGRRLVIGRSRASGSSAPAGAGGFLGGSAIHGLRCASPAATIRRPRLGAEWHSGPSPITSASAKFLALAFWGLGRSGDGSRGRLQPARQCPRLRPREGRPLVFLLSRSRLQPAFSCERDSQETSEKPAGSRLAQKRKKNGSVEGSATPT